MRQVINKIMNQLLIIINGEDDRFRKKNSNTIIISQKENCNIKDYDTFLQADFNSIDDLIKAKEVIKNRLITIDEIFILNKDIDLNMISYQYDYSFIKENYMKLVNIIFFINILIEIFNNKIGFILSFEKDSHFKVHTNNFNQSLVSYLTKFKEDLKNKLLIDIKILN